MFHARLPKTRTRMGPKEVEKKNEKHGSPGWAQRSEISFFAFLGLTFNLFDRFLNFFDFLNIFHLFFSKLQTRLEF